MEEREEIIRAIEQFDAQRDQLGDAATDAALAGLRQRLADLDAADKDAGERRVVTVLFCDVVGSTALAEQMDPERWRMLMNETFNHLTPPVDEYDGTIARLMGDAILAFFGAPTAHEDDPQRAILAALRMHENIRPLRERLRREQDLDFNIRVGINTGLAVVGDVGSLQHGEYTAMGDAVNVAARMEQTAAPGTVQIGGGTYALVEPLFDIEPLGGITVKGKSEPVQAYRILGMKVKPGSLRGLGVHGISGSLIGREQELQRAAAAVERLNDGEGGILAIVGEAGIGKSRLLAELRRQVQGEALRWLEGHNLSYGQTLSFWPFQIILKAETGISEDDSEKEAWSKLEKSVGQLFPKRMDEVLPYVASLLSIEAPGAYGEKVGQLDGEALGRQVYRASRLFFERLAAWKPLVLVFDDIHWMDGSSAGLLEHLLPLVRRAPLLLVGLSRPDQKTPAGRLRQVAEADYADRFTILDLTPLSEADSGQLVHNLLEIESLPAHVLQMMVAKADGNPFYMEEIVRNMIESGALAQDAGSGRWQATPLSESIAVPDTIQGLLLARIDRLDDDLKHIVRHAAVIGRSFLHRVLSNVLDEVRDLDQQMDLLESAEFIQVKQQHPELEYIFKHALAQEAAYESILLQERRKLHARVAETIEALFSDRLNDFYALLAHHYSAAEAWEKAQEYLLRAGDQAGGMAADAEALAHYRRAMEAYGRAHEDDWQPLARARLERKMGEALFRLGEHEQARAYLERAMTLLGHELPDSARGTRLAILRALFTQIAHRLFPGRFVRQMGSLPSAENEEFFKANHALNWIEILVDPVRWLLIVLQGLNLCESTGFAYGAARSAASFSQVFASYGMARLSESYLRRGRQYAQYDKSAVLTAQIEQAWAVHYNLLGEMRKSLESATRTAEATRSAGLLREWAATMMFAAYAQNSLGNIHEAVKIVREVKVVGEEGSDRAAVCWSTSALGAFQMRLGQLDQAIATSSRAMALNKALPDHLGMLIATSWLARAYLAKKEWARALEVAEIGVAVHEARGAALGGYVYLGNALSEIYLAAAEQSEGEERASWLSKAAPVCKKAVKNAKIARPALADAMMLQGRYEWLNGKPASAMKWWKRALLTASEVGELWSEGVIRLEIGQRAGDRDQLLQAEVLLEQVGASHKLAAARHALKAFDP